MASRKRKTLADLPPPDADTVRRLLALLVPATPSEATADSTAEQPAA